MSTASPIHERFRAAALRTPHKLALRADGKSLSYKELLAEVEAMALALRSAGIKEGEHCGVLLPNCAEFVVLLLAGAKLGLVIVPQSTGMSVPGIQRTFHVAAVKHLIAWYGLAPQLNALRSEWSAGIHIAVGGAVDGWLELGELMRHSNDDPAHKSASGPDRVPARTPTPYLMVLTSGSTGAPKPILLSQETKVLRAECAMTLYDVCEDDVVLAATPLYHSLAQRLVLMPLMMGATSVLMPHFTPSSWIAAVQDFEVSFSIAVSSQLKQILDVLETSPTRLPSLRCLVSSSALLDLDTKLRLIQSLACDFHECYGTSEVAIASNLSPADAVRCAGSVGRAVPGAELLILNSQQRPLPAGEAGEIACRTPMAFSGYFEQDEVTQAAHSEGYFLTGDLGRLDEDGYLYFLSRIKDVIITGGVNVYPIDIEEVLARHEDVLECAAIAVPDERMGEVVAVVLALKTPGTPAPIRALQRLCAQHLGDHQQPRHFFVVEAIPRNAIGKIDKLTMRKTYAATLAAPT